VIQKGRMILERVAGELRGTVLLAQREGFQVYRTGLIGRSAREGNDFLDRIDFTPRLPSFSSPGRGMGVFRAGLFLGPIPGRKRIDPFPQAG